MDKTLWQKLQPLMDEALALSLDDRQPWLDRIRIESPTIADELEALLAREGTLDRRGFLDTPLTLGSDLRASLTAEMPADRLARLRVALAQRYVLGDRIGQGGMAEVFRADDIRHGRQVAIKVIRADASSVLGAERFLGEIRLTAKLTHPNILPLLDSGEIDGTLFYVMPYIEGESLRARLRRDGALPVSDTVRLMRAVAEALAYAHEQGTVHRDIKPDNILLAGRQAWVADFGIAKAMASSAPATMGATGVGVALGSPGYMAPEQIEGPDGVDARSDLYSLGAMAWEMLVGRPVFEGKTVPQLFLQHLTVDAPRLESVRADVPEPLAQLIASLLCKAPAGRPSSATEIVTVLDSLGERSPSRLSAGARRVGWTASALTLLGVSWWGATRLMADRPLESIRLTSSGDMINGMLSPDGRRVVFRRRTNPAAVWVREVADSATTRVLVPRLAAGPWAFVDDTTLVVSFRDSLSFVHVGTGVVTTPGWVRQHRLQLAGPGRVFLTSGPLVGPGRLVFTRMQLMGRGDSIALTLDPGEAFGRVHAASERSELLVTLRRADSTVRIERVTADGARTLVRTISSNDTSGVRAAVGTPLGGSFLSPAGDRLFARTALDSLAIIELSDPQRPLRTIPFPYGTLSPPARDGSLMLRTNDHGGRTWRFSVADNMEQRGEIVDQLSGNVHLTALDPTGRLLAQVDGLPGQPNRLSIRTLETGATRQIFTTTQTIVVMHWSPDGTKLAIRTARPNESQRLAVLDVRDGRLITLGRPAIKPGSGILDAGFPPAWSADSRTVFAQDFAHDHGAGNEQFTGVIPDAIVRRYSLVDGDTGIAIHSHLVSRYRRLPKGELDTLWINGLVVSPDGQSIAVGGQTITILPLNGGSPRRVVEADTTITWMYPLSWRHDGHITYATRAAAVGIIGNVFRSYSVSASGGAPRATGAIPATCNNINVLENRVEASCFEGEVRADLVLMRGLR